MKYSLLLLTIPIYILMACISTDTPRSHALKATTQSQNSDMNAGFAVVELFTSQGCSSCPPADKLLTGWLEKAEKEGIDVYPIAFHVDYWNKLGWKDPFSQEQFTKRQSAYADKMSLSSIYTPQAVINGISECVGSSSARLESHIKEALSQTPEARIMIAMPSTIDGVIDQIHYGIDGNFNNCVLNIAMVERGLVTKIKRGENGGRTLNNDNVVRTFTQVTPEKTGSVKINQGQFEKGKLSVVLYLQDKSTLKIKAAKSVGI